MAPRFPSYSVLGTNTPEVGSGGDRIYVPRMNTKALWRMTADYLNAHGAADQIVYAYSTGTEPLDQASYLERYP